MLCCVPNSPSFNSLQNMKPQDGRHPVVSAAGFLLAATAVR